MKTFCLMIVLAGNSLWWLFAGFTLGMAPFVAHDLESFEMRLKMSGVIALLALLQSLLLVMTVRVFWKTPVQTVKRGL